MHIGVHLLITTDDRGHEALLRHSAWGGFFLRLVLSSRLSSIPETLEREAFHPANTYLFSSARSIRLVRDVLTFRQRSPWSTPAMIQGRIWRSSAPTWACWPGSSSTRGSAACSTRP